MTENSETQHEEHIPSEEDRSEDPGGESAERPEGQTSPIRPGLFVGEHEGLSPEEITRILAQRARELARVPPREEVGERLHVVVFTMGEETYAIDSTHVETIRPLEGLTPVPCTPEFVVGVVNLRGRILSVIDLHRFLGLERLDLAETMLVIAIHAEGLDIGLLVDQVLATRALALDDLEMALPTAAPMVAEYTRGVTPDMVVLLDITRILKDQRIIVQEEVR